MQKYMDEMLDTFPNLLQSVVSTHFSEISQSEVLGVRFDKEGQTLYLMTTNGLYLLYHDQDCSENVWLEDVAGGDLQDIVGEKILWAEESTDTDKEYTDGLLMWTFYTIRTNSTTLTLRWCGESNGYYSVDVGTYRVKDSKEILRWWRKKEKGDRLEEYQNDLTKVLYE